MVWIPRFFAVVYLGLVIISVYGDSGVSLLTWQPPAWGRNDLSAVGLFLDIVGALLIWQYGLPADIDPQGRVFVITKSVDEEEVTKGRRNRWLSRIGIGSLVLGFLLQLLSNFAG